MSRILGNTALPGDHRLLRVAQDDGATPAPGHWFRLTLDGTDIVLPVLDHSTTEGWLAFCAPPSAAALTRGAPCPLAGPLGNALQPASGTRRLALVTDETGLPATVFAALRLDIHLVLAGLDSAAPAFRFRPSRFLVKAMAPGAIAGVGALEDAGVPSRIAHADALPGCRDGTLPALVDDWLSGLSARERWDTAVAVLGEAATVETVHQQLRGRVGEIHLHSRPEVE